MKFNQFSIVEKSMEEKINELKELGFDTSLQADNKELFSSFLAKIPYDLSTLLASNKESYLDFLASSSKLSWDVFYTIGLQLLGFTAFFDFSPEQSLEFASDLGINVLEGELSAETLIEAWYLLLLTRSKEGSILIEKFVADDFLPMDNKYHFFNDKSLATFDTKNLIKEVVYVESSVDSNFDGKKDLIKVQIIRPKYEGKLPSVMTASPYHLGVNTKANDDRLHPMEADLIQKEEKSIELINQDFSDILKITPSADDLPLTDETEKFTHGWTYTLNDYLLARGFASIYVAGIGTRGSDGFMTSGDYQQVASVTAVIDWLNGRRPAYSSHARKELVEAAWANGLVAMTGKSYLGTLAYGAATTGVQGLEVILAEAGISSWYDYYRDNGAISSPGGFPGEDLDVLAALTYSKNLDGADYLKNNSFYEGELDKMTAEIDRKSGDYNQYWHDRNYLPHLDKVRADVLAVHGLQDWNVKPKHAYEYVNGLPEHLVSHSFLHQGEHIYINNFQSLDFSETINTYFTGKLLGRKLNLKLPKVIWQENNVEGHFKELENFGEATRKNFKLGHEISKFENSYPQDKFTSYSQNYKNFIKDLYEGEANASYIDLKIDQDLLVNGKMTLNVRIKLNDSKGLLSAQIIELGQKKRLNSLASVLEPKAIDLGHNFIYDDLKELKLADSPYKLISKSLMNLQNREDLLKITEVPKDTWMDVKLDLQPTIYQLKAGDTIRIALYSTDFELTIRDNRQVTYEIDLENSSLSIPYTK
ncbi:Xaa-Pro dipeptidyl-peptidase [Streptococcaceae bacterium ESL0687]|nr:Xaa-Pro dipeptidyl-peptidase [Streptococcaceae bacterium ESL0687]